MGQNLLYRLRTQAVLVRQRERLGDKAPPWPIDYETLAKLLDEAADRIVELERER
jgi:hypothetical protein